MNTHTPIPIFFNIAFCYNCFVTYLFFCPFLYLFVDPSFSLMDFKVSCKQQYTRTFSMHIINQRMLLLFKFFILCDYHYIMENYFCFPNESNFFQTWAYAYANIWLENSYFLLSFSHKISTYLSNISSNFISLDIFSTS